MLFLFFTLTSLLQFCFALDTIISQDSFTSDIMKIYTSFQNIVRLSSIYEFINCKENKESPNYQFEFQSKGALLFCGNSYLETAYVASSYMIIEYYFIKKKSRDWLNQVCTFPKISISSKGKYVDDQWNLANLTQHMN